MSILWLISQKRSVMTRRRWNSKIKAKIMLEGLSGWPVSELCNQYQISQTQYCQWRDKLPAEPHQTFEARANGTEIARLKAKNQRLQ